jgi:hypothetical protein
LLQTLPLDPNMTPVDDTQQVKRKH